MMGTRRIAGRYRVESELGRGGMGAVYRAWDDGKQRVVALKLLESSDARLIALFEREYETLAMLAHPRVIEAYDFGHAGHGARYYTMELLEGGDLTTRAPLPWLSVCHLRCWSSTEGTTILCCTGSPTARAPSWRWSWTSQRSSKGILG